MRFIVAFFRYDTKHPYPIYHPNINMIRSKHYVSGNDLHLSEGAMQAILTLNECIPESCGMIWVTVQEMRERLVRCGVHHTLKTQQIDLAIQKLNRSGRLDKDCYRTRTYFRQSCFVGGSPKDQLANRLLSIMPRMGYDFSSLSEGSGHLRELNRELERINNIEAKIEAGDIIGKG